MRPVANGTKRQRAVSRVAGRHARPLNLDIMMLLCKHHDVRTTLTLDDDVATRLQAEARRSGRPFKAVVNEYLRLGLAHRRSMRSAPAVDLEIIDLGGPLPGYGYDNVAELLEAVEGPRHR